MKKHLNILLSLLIMCSFSFIGTAQNDFYDIDRYVRLTPDSVEKKVKTLGAYLAKGAKNEKEIVRSIYQWLIHNIKYDHHAYTNGNRRINRNNADILKRKEAICWGYATLFKALCEEVKIESEIISGYSKRAIEATGNIESPNHAWNGVKIDSTWYLLDATWGSNAIRRKSDFEQKFGYTYFLTPPSIFIVNHLPANPEWQLLTCPIDAKSFRLPADTIISLAKRENCKKIVEKIPDFANIHEKRLSNALKTYQYNPTEKNRRELAHSQLDYEAYLSTLAERLQSEQKIDSLSIIQSQMIELCEIANEQATLFDTQLENCAYNYFNYAITLTQTMQGEKTERLKKWKTILQNFEIAQEKIKNLSQNFFTKNALKHCVDYIDYSKEHIELLKNERLSQKK